MRTPEPTRTDEADRIVLSYRSVDADADREQWLIADNDWIRDELSRDSFVGYLRKVHGGVVEKGDEWEEFVSCGCASPKDVIIRVEALEGGTVFGERSAVEIVPRRDILAA